jgi:hypothetical protein
MKPLDLLPESFMTFGEAYYYGYEAATDIREGIEGRAIFYPHEAGVLAQMVHDARHSDHVEIGTLFGASAILVAMVKAKFNMHGYVYCVDPLEMRKVTLDDLNTGTRASSDLVMKNAEHFAVADRLKLVLAYSHPWPLENRTFGTGYIDGDHWNGAPRKDWISLKNCVKYGVIFDDYCHGKPEVHEAVMEAANDPDWIIVHIAGTMAFLRKRE